VYISSFPNHHRDDPVPAKSGLAVQGFVKIEKQE